MTELTILLPELRLTLQKFLIFLIDFLHNIAIILRNLACHSFQLHFKLMIMMYLNIFFLLQSQNSLLKEPNLIVFELDILHLNL
jgi:hypothetical protein